MTTKTDRVDNPSLFPTGPRNDQNGASANDVSETVPLAEATSVPRPTTAPPASDSWRPSLEVFTYARRPKDHPDLKGKSKRIKKFYREQNKLIEAFEVIYTSHGESMPEDETESTDRKQQRRAEISAKVSFFVNLALFVGKMVATVMSGSLSILSSVIDSAVDLISGAVMWWTSKAIKSRNYDKYPQGKRKMEPLAILVLSVIMAMASAMVIIKSAEQIQTYVKSADQGPNVGVRDIVIICSTIVLKLILYLVMRRIKVPSVQALSQDHRNDVLSNTVALVMGIIGSKLWRFADPIGALVIAAYIVASWMVTAGQQIRLLAGRAAGADFQKKITWLCLNHSPEICSIDTVVVYHFGTNFLVEVDIVLPETMIVREAHDIQETLQQRLESLPEVERAFVHIDYEATHPRSMEHKVV